MRVLRVTELQQFLRAQGFDDVMVDGVLGPATQNAFLVWAASAAPGVAVTIHQEADYAVMQPEDLALLIGRENPETAQAGVGAGVTLVAFLAFGAGWWIWSKL